MPITSENLTGRVPGHVEAAIAVAGTDLAIAGPSQVPIGFHWIAIGTASADVGLIYSPTESTVNATTGIVTVRLYTRVAATYRLWPIYGKTSI